MSAVGVVLVGHGDTASRLHAAAMQIVPGGLEDVVAVDAGVGENATLGGSMCAAIEKADHGRGVLLLVDLVGASPCNCAQREAGDHPIVTVSGLNLAMLLKLASVDRSAVDTRELAQELVRSARRAVTVDGADISEDGGQEHPQKDAGT